MRHTSSSWLYLMVNVLTLVGPLARSFEPKVRFFSRWFALWPALGITAALFIAWDVVFTRLGVWGFNAQYLIGVGALGLPLEEWLFFITVPYACVFTYECLNRFWPLSGSLRWARFVAAVLALLALGLAVTYRERTYTMVTCGLSGLCMAWAWWGNLRIVAAFFRAYAVSLIPFLGVNGVLTGALTEHPIVWYNDDENIGLRIGTIPVEDAFYLLPLLWLVIVQYEARLCRSRGH